MEEFEDTDYVASEHDQLISEVSKLDKTQHIAEPTRNEPSLSNSEFNLIKRSNKLDLNKVAKVLTDTAGHVKIAKKLKKAQDVEKVLSKPLEKPQAERVKRAAGYEQTKKQIGRWDPVVARSRSSDFVSFPLKHVEHRLQPTDQFLSKLKMKSDLEKELEEVDPPAEVEEQEKEQVYPMSYDEMVEHRQHVAKMRAQQSYVAAKAKRQSKIKSKKYHRILKKEKLKQQLKEFEELQKTNPEEALKKLEALEKTRALERHTLRHKNTGKWARNKMIRAKYDKEVRNQLAEQLAVGRSLTQKPQDVESSDDDDGQIIPDISLAQDPMNPWMMSQKDKSNINTEFDFGYKKYLNNRMFKIVDDSDSDSELNKGEEQNLDSRPVNNDLGILKESIIKLYNNNNVDDDFDECNMDKSQMHHKKKKEFHDNQEAKTEQLQHNGKQSKLKIKGTKMTPKVKFGKPVATSSWSVETIKNKMDNIKSVEAPNVSHIFKTLEIKAANKVERKLKRLRQDIEQLEKLTEQDTETKHKKKKSSKSHARANLDNLKLKNQKIKVVIDEALRESTSKQADSLSNIEKNNISTENLKALANITTEQTADSQKINSDIDPTRFIEVKPKFLNNVVPEGETELDQLDDDEQVVPRVNIEEVFEEDDVVASFRQEKEDEINNDKDDINLTLPGWGVWGGKGVKVRTPKRRRNRFIQKPAPVMPRKDENKGDIIIKEYKDPNLQIHKVKELPYPFKSVKDYEASIRAPVSNTFIPEKPFKNLIRPSVITKAGTIIEPMDEEELLLPRKEKFRNQEMIKFDTRK